MARQVLEDIYYNIRGVRPGHRGHILLKVSAASNQEVVDAAAVRPGAEARALVRTVGVQAVRVVGRKRREAALLREGVLEVRVPVDEAAVVRRAIAAGAVKGLRLDHLPATAVALPAARLVAGALRGDAEAGAELALVPGRGRVGVGAQDPVASDDVAVQTLPVKVGAQMRLGCGNRLQRDSRRW